MHAGTVRLIYRLALEGDGTSCSMGVKNIVACLNQRRILTRGGGRWGIGRVHRILTRTTYVGRHDFNKRAKDKTLKPTSEILTGNVPPLIEQATFDALQAHLRARNQKVTPAHVVSGPTLLSGICFCADCGGAMTLRTGKGGRHRYDACSIKARQGETGCKGRSIPMDKLDNLVAEHIADRLPQPGRLKVQRFARKARERIRIDGGGYRRDHLRALAQRVEVADREVRILRSKSNLLHTLTAAAGAKPATPCVRSSVLSGGRGGIRTHEGALPPAGFQDRCLKPLGHPSLPPFESRAPRHIANGACGRDSVAATARRSAEVPATGRALLEVLTTTVPRRRRRTTGPGPAKSFFRTHRT